MDTRQTLGTLVTETPAAAKVFHRYGLDFCCGGEQPLERACEEIGIDPRDVLEEVEEQSPDEGGDVRWDTRPIPEQNLSRPFLESLVPAFLQPLRDLSRSNRDDQVTTQTD